jgi:hypothetical protein
MVEVADICVENALELLLMEDEQMVEAFTPHTPSKPFTDGIRSRSVIRNGENLDVTRLNNPSEAHPELAIMITDEILRSLSKGGGLPQLLGGPRVGRISCDADVDHLVRVQFDDEESEERMEKQVSDWQEIAGPDLPGMSAQEGRPVLTPWPSRTHVSHVLLDRSRADAKPQLEQFAADPFGSPEQILHCH